MKILFCGDPHSQFRHIVEGSDACQADAVVMLGDLEPARPLHLELETLVQRQTPIWFIHGNHDSDSDETWRRVWESDLADRNLHGRVVEFEDGTRLAGLGGVFRESVWHPSPSAARRGQPAFQTRTEHARATPRQDRWRGGPHRRHWGSIYPEDVDALSLRRADILVSHEAPGYHPNGFQLLDDLARSMGVRVSVHGHHHDNLDSSSHWPSQGFASYGVGLRGLSLLDTATMSWTAVRNGDLDMERSSRAKKGM